MKSAGTRKGVLLAGVVVLWTALGYACATEDENPATVRSRLDSGSGGEGSTDDSGEGGGPVGAPICGKYGGYDAVKPIAAAILNRVSADCRIGNPLTKLSAEQSAHFTECLEIQIGGAFQCPGISYVSNTTVDSAGKKCRDMTNAHKGLNLRNADFNAFLEAVSTELTNHGLTTDEIKNLAPVFEGTRNGVVQQTTQPDRNTYCTCQDGVYNGKPCTVDAGILDSGLDVTDAADAADGDGG